MDEFWVCQYCRSLNRAGTGKCYSCRKKYGTNPPEGSPVVKAAAAAAPPPAGPVPNLGAAAAPAPYFSRPVALAPAAAAGRGVSGASHERSHFPNPVAAVRRRIAWWLAMRQSVSIGWLGYLTAALLVLILVVGAAICLTVLPAAANLLQHSDPGKAWAQLTAGQKGLLKSLSITMVVAGVLALSCFSAFVGLTTHNASGLGADQPMLAPYRAGTCWVGVLWAQARIAVGLVVPAALLWQGYEIPGLVAAIVALEIAHRHLDDPGGWLSRPSRHLPDLYAKLGVEGSISSPLASIWSASFSVANGMAIAVSAIPVLAFLLVQASATAGRNDIVGWQSTGFGPAQTAIALLVTSLVAWTAIALALLVPITLGLVQRQRTRRTLVRVGRARSWVARPGEGGYNPASPTNPIHSGGYDDEDRIVERLPGFGTETAAGPAATGPGFGGPGFGRPGIGGPGFGGPSIGGPGLGGPSIGGPGLGGPSIGGPSQGSPGQGGPGFGSPGQGGPGQASLYSPSTTSSFPWSEEPPAEPD